MRAVAVAAAVLALGAAVAPAGTKPRWQHANASWYSWRSTGSTTQGCPGAPPLADSHLSLATELVACGTRVQVCYRRCVIATRTDSGPFLHGLYVPSWRAFDLNVATAHAIGLTGVQTIRWRLAR